MNTPNNPEPPGIVVEDCGDKTAVDLGKDATMPPAAVQPLLASSGPHGTGISRKEERESHGAFGGSPCHCERIIIMCMCLRIYYAVFICLICMLYVLTNPF